MSKLEDEYIDVLQNIESAIISVYREHSELTDYDVEKALNALIVAYQAEQRERTSKPVTFPPLAQLVYERVSVVCEWRLGRDSLVSTKSEAAIPPPAPLAVEEIVACLKRIRKSVQKWNKREGRRGYLEFVKEFIV